MKIPPNLIAQARDALARQDYSKAERLYRKALEYQPLHWGVRSNLAVIFNETNRIEEFHKLATELVEGRPQDPGALNKLGIALYRMGKFQEAYEKLKEAAKLDSSRFETFLNLSSIAGEVGDVRGGLEYGLEAIKLDPKNVNAHINLGSAFMQAGKVDEAKHCFETVCILDPNNSFAMTNLAVLATKGGNHSAAIIEYERCLTNPKLTLIDEKKLRFFLGLSYLTVGNFKEGWHNYRYGFIDESQNGRNPCRRFSVLEWDGLKELSESDTLLVWREQGLGDELLFFSVLPDLEKLPCKVIIECDWRLCELIKRSYPGFRVRPQAYMDKPLLTSPFNDFTHHIPVGNLFGLFRNSSESFKFSGAYLKVDEKKKALFESRLGDRNGSLRLGISWRSGQLSAMRNTNYTSIVDWEPLLKLPNIQFVNLQYGDTESERMKAVNELGVLINHWSDLDLKEDLDNTAALCSCLDLVISVGNASAQLSAATGTETIIMTRRLGWPAFGQGRNVTYPNSEYLTPISEDKALPPLIAELAGHISQHLLEQKSKDGPSPVRAKDIVRRLRSN
jgi:Flp pilus assembly protein TadD